MQKLQKIIEDAFLNKEHISKKNLDPIVSNAIKKSITGLDNGTLRVSEKINNQWITNEWLKKAILLLFHVKKNQLITLKDWHFFDKLPLKFSQWNNEDFKNKNLRIIPPATIRYGSYIANNVVIMPSYINIGSYIDSGTMIDTWVTVGSCAQIGKNVHLSGGVGIGGILEPIQNTPTIIEDNCFIGARSEIAEGVIIEEGSVISMGVFIGQSTKIYDRINKKIFYGRVPAGSVVVPGSLPSKNNHDVNIYCAVIVKTVDNTTLKKTKINDLLRQVN